MKKTFDTVNCFDQGFVECKERMPVQNVAGFFGAQVLMEDLICDFIADFRLESDPINLMISETI